MAQNVAFQIVGEFIDKISPTLNQLTQNNIPGLIGALAGLSAALGVNAFATMIKNAADAGDALSKLAQRSGIAVEALSALQTAAALSDVSTEELASSLQKLNQKLADAAGDENSKAANVFKQLGISVKDANGNMRDASDVMGDLADKFASTRDDANKVAVAMDTMGKAGVQMITVLNGGRESLESFKKLNQDLGFEWTKEQTKDAERFNDALTILQMALGGLSQIIAKDLLPKLALIAEYMAESVKEGGLLRAVLDGLATIISGPVGAALDILATAGAVVAVIFHQVGIAIGGALAVLTAFVNGDWDQIGPIIDMVRADLKRLDDDFAKFQDELWNPEKIKKGAEETKGTIGTVSDAGKKLAEEFDKAYQGLQKELTAINQTGKTSEVLYQVQFGAWRKFNEQQKEKLIGLAREIDLQKTILTLSQQEQSIRAARNTKLANAELGFNLTQISDPKERAGYESAEAQKIQASTMFNKELEDAQKNADVETRERIIAEINERMKLYDVNGRLYEQAKQFGIMTYELNTQAKIYNEVIGNQKTKVAELVEKQAELERLLQQGRISQDEYALAVKNTTREIEDLKNSTTEAGLAFLEIAKNRRSMDDIVVRMAALRDQQESGKISAEEYKQAMFNLQQSYDSLNPTFAINQVQKMEDQLRSAAGSFESMFSSGIFDIMQGNWQNLGDLVKKTIDRMVADMLAAQLQFALFGDLGSTPAGKTPNSTGILGGLFTSFFGGFRESGGPVTAGKAYIVGEKRPEVFVPSTNGTILPNVDKVASGSGNQSNVSISISALDGADVMRVLSNSKRELAQMLNTTTRNYNLR